MNDMSAVIIPKSDQINADNLLGGPMTITITSVTIRPGTEQPVSIHFQGDDGKPYKPCKSMARVMVHCWGRDANQYVGRSMTIYCDPKVQWGGLAVGGIRISHMSDLKSSVTLALTATKGNKKPYTVQPLAAPPTAPRPTVIEWLDALETRLRAAQTAGAVDAIIAEEATQKALDTLRNGARERLNALVKAALGRTQADPDPSAPPPDDDGWPGPR